MFTAEYCEQLRKSIKTGQPISNHGARYIDTCEFWKDQYTKIHLENKALQDKIHKLEQGNSKLLGNIHEEQDLLGLVVSTPQPSVEPGNVVRVDNQASRKRPTPFQGDGLGDQEPQAFSCSEDHCLIMSNYGKPSAQSKISPS